MSNTNINVVLLLIILVIITQLSSIHGGIFGSSAIFNSETWIPIPEESKSSSSSPKPPPPVSDTWLSNDVEIFVGIVHYRDPRCPVTLKNLYTKAKYPKRVNVGMIKQRHTEEDINDCVKSYCLLMGKTFGNGCPYQNQIKSIEMSFLDSRGPTHARHMQQFLLADEEFCMQIDSHSDFISDWDVAITSMWGSVQNEYAVLSTLAPDISLLGKNVNDHWEVPHLCQATFTDR